MMDESKVLELLEKLYAATSAGRLSWSETSSSGKFRVSLGKGDVEIEKETAEELQSGTRLANYVLWITNDQGKVIDVEFIDEGVVSRHAAHACASKLYSEVRKAVLRVDETVDELLEIIDNKLK